MLVFGYAMKVYDKKLADMSGHQAQGHDEPSICCLLSTSIGSTYPVHGLCRMRAACICYHECRTTSKKSANPHSHKQKCCCAPFSHRNEPAMVTRNDCWRFTVCSANKYRKATRYGMRVTYRRRRFLGKDDFHFSFGCRNGRG